MKIVRVNLKPSIGNIVQLQEILTSWTQWRCEQGDKMMLSDRLGQQTAHRSTQSACTKRWQDLTSSGKQSEKKIATGKWSTKWPTS